VRIAELSERTGLPVATIKFYLRDGLLMPGAATAPNQATYGEEHVERLRLIRILAEVGGLSLGRIRDVVRAIDDPAVRGQAAVRAALHALGPVRDGPPAEVVAPDERRARDEADRFVDDELGWQVSSSAPGRRALGAALAALRRSGADVDASILRPYARAADWLASEETESFEARVPTDDVVQRVMVRTVVLDAALTALRHLAREHRAAVASRTAPAG
jgi:DNA-binding transcriptional MerR regulator